MNIIYSPDQKYFTLPIILIAEYYKSIGEQVVVVCSNLTEKMFSLYGFHDTSTSDSEHLKENVNCVFFQHNTSGAINFYKRKIDAIRDRVDSFKISLMPDGLGNTMYGESYPDIAKSITDRTVILKDVFCFGFVHSTVARLYDRSYIRELSFDGLNNYLQAAIKSEENGHIINVLSSHENIFFITYRPWGTKNFHGGMYDCGSPQKQAKIYNDLVAHCAKTFSIPLEKSLLVYRGDSRFPEEASQVYESINFDEKFFLDDWMNDCYTLEFIIYYLINRTSSDVFIITLDSTTFQSVPFLRCDNQGKIVGSIGCFESQLIDFSEGNSVFVKKILGKVNDFRNRYKLIEEASNTRIKIDSIDKGHFYVDVR